MLVILVYDSPKIRFRRGDPDQRQALNSDWIVRKVQILRLVLRPFDLNIC